MRIGFLTTSFPRYAGDCAGNFVFGMARALLRKGHAVTVLAPAPTSIKGSAKHNRWLDGIELVQIPYTWPASRGKLFYNAGVPDNLASHPWVASQIPTALASFFLNMAIRAKSFDSIVSHWLLPSALIAGMVRSYNPKLKHLAISHSTDIHMLGKLPFSHLLADRISKSADHIGFVSPRLRSEFLSMVSPLNREFVVSRSSVTPMGVDFSELQTKRDRHEIRAELEIGINEFTVLFLGRLVPIKGVDLLIDAVKRAGGINLVVAGDGPNRHSLEEQARNAGVNTHFLGEVGPVRRAELLKSCDTVAVPSRRLADGRTEGLPLTIMEALAAQRPVIATSVADSGKILAESDCGIVVSPENSKELAKALLILRHDPIRTKQLGVNGLAVAKNRDWTALVESYEALLMSY